MKAENSKLRLPLFIMQNVAVQMQEVWSCIPRKKIYSDSTALNEVTGQKKTISS